LEAQLIKKGRRKMKIMHGGHIVQDTSSPEYTEQANKLLKTTEEHAKELKAERSKAAEQQEQQRSTITDLSAEQQVLKSQLGKQQQALLEQTTTERNHRFASNADSVQSLINGKIIGLSKTDGSNPASAREIVSATLANLNSAPDSLSFGPMHSETITPESFTKEKLGLEGLTKDESLLLTKLILSINGIKYKENQDGGLSDISSPKTTLFIPKAKLNYQEAIVLKAGTNKVDIIDAFLANLQLTELGAEELIRNLLQRQGIEFTEGENITGSKEFRFPEALSTEISLGERTLVDGVIGKSITVPSTDELQSMIKTEETEKRQSLFKRLLPLGLVGGLLIPTGVVITNNPEITGLEKPTPATRLLKEEGKEINALKLKYPSDDRIENSTLINREQGENVSQVLVGVYPGYLNLAHMQRQEIEHRLLNKLGIPNDIKVYPHGGDVISRLPSQIEVPSIKYIYQQIKSLPVNDGSKPGRGFSLTELYHTLTKRTPVD
jgi:hypothetical protein